MSKSKIHIKKANRGKFTAWAKSHGMGVQEAAGHVMANKDKYSSTVVKRANFAKNAAGWHHEDGGEVDGYAMGNYVGQKMSRPSSTSLVIDNDTIPVPSVYEQDYKQNYSQPGNKFNLVHRLEPGQAMEAWGQKAGSGPLYSDPNFKPAPGFQQWFYENANKIASEKGKQVGNYFDRGVQTITKKMGGRIGYEDGDVIRNQFVNTTNDYTSKPRVSDLVDNAYMGESNQDLPGYVNPGGAQSTYATPSSTAPESAPKKAMSFGEAFAQARKSGDKVFTWNGKKYTTEVKGSASSTKRANDEKDTYKPNTRNTVVPKKEHTPADGGMNPEYQRPRLKVPGNVTAARDNTRVAPVNQPTMASPQAQERRALEERSKQSYTFPEAEVVADRTRYDMSPAFRMNNPQQLKNFPQLPPYSGALANIPKKKRGGLLDYARNANFTNPSFADGGSVKTEYADGGKIEKSDLADNDPHKSNPDVSHVIRTQGGDFPVFHANSESAKQWRAEYAEAEAKKMPTFQSKTTGLTYRVSEGAGSTGGGTSTTPAPNVHKTPAEIGHEAAMRSRAASAGHAAAEKARAEYQASKPTNYLGFWNKGWFGSPDASDQETYAQIERDQDILKSGLGIGVGAGALGWAIGKGKNLTAAGKYTKPVAEAIGKGAGASSNKLGAFGRRITPALAGGLAVTAVEKAVMQGMDPTKDVDWSDFGYTLLDAALAAGTMGFVSGELNPKLLGKAAGKISRLGKSAKTAEAVAEEGSAAWKLKNYPEIQVPKGRPMPETTPRGYISQNATPPAVEMTPASMEMEAPSSTTSGAWKRKAEPSYTNRAAFGGNKNVNQAPVNPEYDPNDPFNAWKPKFSLSHGGGIHTMRSNIKRMQFRKFTK